MMSLWCVAVALRKVGRERGHYYLPATISRGRWRCSVRAWGPLPDNANLLILLDAPAQTQP
jgi:hypothetical protein